MSNPLEEAVRVAEGRVERASRRVLDSHGELGAFEELTAARDACASADRALASARGEEVAVPFPWEPPWDGGAPIPHVVSDGRRTLLAYRVGEPVPGWDGTTANVVDRRALRPEPLVLVEILGCYGHRFGGPNDEVFAGHRLARRGFDGYGAYEVQNSRWLAEEQATNRVHSQYSDAHWTPIRHFLLAFHDDVFECLATGFRIEPTRTSVQQILTWMVDRIVGEG